MVGNAIVLVGSGVGQVEIFMCARNDQLMKSENKDGARRIRFNATLDERKGVA